MKKFEKTVYISHPLDDDPSYNMLKVLALGKELIKENPSILFIIPHMMVVPFLELKKDGLEYCIELMKKCDEVWVYRGFAKKSKGVNYEVKMAKKLGIPVYGSTVWGDFSEK